MLRKFAFALLLAFPIYGQQPVMRSTLGSGYGLLGKLTSGNFNSTADQPITINLPGGATKYVIQNITCTNASTSLTLAVGGFYAAASKTTAIVANTQVFTALTAAAKYVAVTLNALVGTDIRTETTLYLSLTTGQGGAATADCYIYGNTLP
jgi:hypothetical protein